MNRALIAAMALAAWGLLPTVAAAVSYGSQVGFGDSDFVPTLAASPTAVRVCQINFGDLASIRDDGFYLDFSGATPLADNDVRLVAPAGIGKTAGTLVANADAVERRSTEINCQPLAFGVIDVNGNARHDAGDWLILHHTRGWTNDPSGVAAGASTNPGFIAGDIRLTQTDGGPAGTLALPGDSDLVGHSGVFAAGSGFPTMALRYFDGDLSTGWNGGGDRLYASGSSTAAGSLVGIGDVRLHGDAGQFGTQVRFGDAEFKPTAAAVKGLTGGTGATASIKQINLANGLVADSCFYWSQGIVAAIAPGDVRLTPCRTRAAGTQVTTADTPETSAALVPGGDPIVVFADANQNGHYDAGDAVYLTTAPSGFSGATSTTAWTLRLTPHGGFSAGSLVRTGDSDQTSYGPGAVAPGGAVTFAFFDADRSCPKGCTLGTTPFGNGFSLGDALYLGFGGPTAGRLLPTSAIRLANGAGPFGTQLGLGDPDFAPAALAGVASFTSALKQTNPGTGAILDSCFYHDPNGGALATGALRLSACGGNAAGTLVAAADAEKGTPVVADHPPPRLAYVDVDGNGRFNPNDPVYVTTGGAPNLPASTGTGSFTLRLTPASGHPAGTIVRAGDSDQVAYGSAAPSLVAANPIGVAAFDSDLSATLTPGDIIYLDIDHGASLVAGAPFDVASIRLGTAPSTPGRFPTQTTSTNSTPSTSPSPSPAPLTVAAISPASGAEAGGEVVTIAGTGFYPGAQVRFDAAVATDVTVVDSTAITAVTPAHAPGMANVVVILPDGRSVILPQAFSFNAPSDTSTPSATDTPTSPPPTVSASATSATAAAPGWLEPLGDVVDQLASALPRLMTPAVMVIGVIVGGSIGVSSATKPGKPRKDGEEKEPEKNQKREREGPCVALHARQQEPEGTQETMEVWRDGEWHRVPTQGAGRKQPKRDAAGAPPMRRRVVAPEALLLEVAGSGTAVELEMEADSASFVRRLKRLPIGDGDCPHPFAVEGGLALTGALRVEGLRGRLEARVEMELDVQVVTDNEAGSAITDPLIVRQVVVGPAFVLEGDGLARTVPLTDVAGLGAIPMSDALELGEAGAPWLSEVTRLMYDAPSFQWGDVGAGHFVESVEWVAMVRRARIAVKVEGEAGRVRFVALVACLRASLTDSQCPDLEYPQGVDALAEAAEKAREAESFLRNFAAGVPQVAVILDALDGRAQAAVQVAGKAKSLGSKAWVTVFAIALATGVVGFTVPVLPEWMAAMLGSGGLAGVLGHVWARRTR